MNFDSLMLHSLVKRFNQLDTRRRLLIVGAWLLVLWVAVDAVFVAPVVTETAALKNEIEVLDAQIVVQGLEKNKLKKQVGEKIGKTPEQELADLEQRLAELKTRLDKRANSLVEPVQMVELLRQLFKQQARVRLLDVESLKPEPIITRLVTEVATDDRKPANAKTEKAVKPAQPPPEPDFYKHSVRLTFDGSYRDIARYLVAVEALPWQIYWSELSLFVDKYPRSKVTLEVYTLSRDKAWLGV